MPFFGEEPRELPCGAPDEAAGAIRLCPGSHPWCACSSGRCAREIAGDICGSGFAYLDGSCLEPLEAASLRPSTGFNHPGCLAICTADGHCDDGAPCNGQEWCDNGTCAEGIDAQSGAACLLDSGWRGVCRGGRCALATCGNGQVDPGEECDDGNSDDLGDGCRDDCTWRCSRDPDCNGGDPCTGYDRCDGEGHTCLPGDPILPEGAACSVNGIVGKCRSSGCVPDSCGNGVVEGGEECDDGNASDNDSCPITCRRASCGDGALFLGVEECDDGNAVDGDGCDACCRWPCVSNEDCAAKGYCKACDVDARRCEGIDFPDGRECILRTGIPSNGVCAAGECVNTGCSDEDHDGYGVGSVCAGSDCDDSDPNNWLSCGTCMDGDGDGFFAGCDAYVTLQGPDCDDGNMNCDADCTDADSDGFCFNHDCDDGDAARFPSNPEICDRKDNDCDTAVDEDLGCITVHQGSRVIPFNPLITDKCVDAYYDYNNFSMNPDPDLMWNNRTVIMLHQSTCDGLSFVLVNDAGSDSSGGGLDAVITIDPPSAFSEATFVSDEPWECAYASSTGVTSCSWNWLGGQTDGVAMGSFTGSFCLTLSFSNIAGVNALMAYDGATGGYATLYFADGDVEICTS